MARIHIFTVKYDLVVAFRRNHLLRCYDFLQNTYSCSELVECRGLIQLLWQSGILLHTICATYMGSKHWISYHMALLKTSTWTYGAGANCNAWVRFRAERRAVVAPVCFSRGTAPVSRGRARAEPRITRSSSVFLYPAMPHY